jgi:hypothetical protein
MVLVFDCSSFQVLFLRLNDKNNLWGFIARSTVVGTFPRGVLYVNESTYMVLYDQDSGLAYSLLLELRLLLVPPLLAGSEVLLRRLYSSSSEKTAFHRHTRL